MSTHPENDPQRDDLPEPIHGQVRFNRAPAEWLSASIPEVWETAGLKGFSEGAMLHEARDWLAPLWDRWMGPAGLRKDERLMGGHPAELLGPMLAGMSPEDSTRRAVQL